MKLDLPELNLPSPLLDCLHIAVRSSVCADGEERGGWLLSKGESYFEFVPIRNNNHGLPQAKVIFDMNKEEVGENVVIKLCTGWDSWGSFHVHPQSPICSSIDATKLFLGFKRNYIYGMGSKTMILYERVRMEEVNDLVDEQQVIWYSMHGDIVIWKLSYVKLRTSELPELEALADSSVDCCLNMG